MRPSKYDNDIAADLLHAVAITTALQVKDPDASQLFERARKAAHALEVASGTQVRTALRHRTVLKTTRQAAAALLIGTRSLLGDFRQALKKKTHDPVGNLLDEETWDFGRGLLEAYAPDGGTARLARGGPLLQQQVTDLGWAMIEALGDEHFLDPLQPLVTAHDRARQAMVISAGTLASDRQRLILARQEAQALCRAVRACLVYKAAIGDPDAVPPDEALPRQAARWKAKAEARKKAGETPKVPPPE